MKASWLGVLIAGIVLGVSMSAQGQGKEEVITPPAVETAQVGKVAPGFTLKDVHGKEVSLASFKGKTVVLEWFNPGCPFVKRVHLENGPMPSMVKKDVAGGGVWLAINSGAPGNQGTGTEANLQALKDYSVTWPLLIDEPGKVGHLYGATKTPHVFVINGEGTLVYAGGVDSTKGGGYGKAEFVNYLQDALDQTAAGTPVKVSSTPAWGCSVKYKK